MSDGTLTADAGERMLYTTPSATYVAHNCVGLPKAMPLCAEHLAAYLSPPRHRIVHPN